MIFPMQHIRAVRSTDAKEMLEIYRPYVLETPISFETEVPSLEEFQARIAETTKKFPWLVYERDGKILAYAYASPFKSRCAYEWSVESTVYVQKYFHGQGMGKALYENLLKILKAQGAVNVIGGISLPNAASVGLHEFYGFRKVANFQDVGFKLGQWWDVGYWQLQLQKPETPGKLLLPK
jgi:L-amino acid N-acyltransferase YncA